MPNMSPTNSWKETEISLKIKKKTPPIELGWKAV